jgi:predicted nucleic acid-binding protein
LESPNEAYICFASVAELFSLATRLGWQAQKIERLNAAITTATIIGVSGNASDKLLQYYVAIDTYSQGQHPTLQLPEGLSARNMGKNDIWIAATAAALNATLITTDKDFSHLNGIFCKVCLVEQQV